MKRIAGVSRRQFMASVGTLAGIALLPGCGPSAESRELGARLVEGLETVDAWKRVGVAYLESTPSQPGLERLTAVMVEDLGWDPVAGTAKDLAERVVQRVRRDFREGRTVEVEGWVLSATEARLAAIAAQV